jgi:tetratricopeptide (TPR) repeat protein
MTGNIYILLTVLVAFCNPLHAQDKKGDSLKLCLAHAKKDTVRVMVLNQLCLYNEFNNRTIASNYIQKSIKLARKKNYARGLANAYLYAGYLADDVGNNKAALRYFNLSYNCAKKNNLKRSMAAALNSLGNIYGNKSEYKKALECFNKAITINKEIGNKQGIATQLGNMGNSYKDQGNFPKAIECYFSALKIDEQLNNQEGISRHLGNIGIVYLEKNEFNKALFYFNKALKIDTKLGDEAGVARHLGNIGNVYVNSNQLSIALPYQLKAAKIEMSQGNDVALSNTYGNIGILYYGLADSAIKKGNLLFATDSLFPTAMRYHLNALNMNKKLDDKLNMVISYGNIGKLWQSMGNKAQAEKFLLSSISLADSIGSPHIKIEAEKSLSTLYESTGEFEKSFLHAKEYEKLKDSVFNAEKNNALIRTELNYEFDKKETSMKAAQERQKARATANNERLLLLILLVAAVAISIAATAIITLRSLRQARHKKTIIEAQKSLVEQKQKEILDSIHYAKRIQRALLPSEKYIQRTINNHQL